MYVFMNVGERPVKERLPYFTLNLTGVFERYVIPNI